jgi:hypothetical protein
MRTRYWALVVLVLTGPGARAHNFDYLTVGADGEGFITVSEGGGPAERFFPLGTFFYPALQPQFDEISGPTADFARFAGMGGNLVVAPWVPDQWPNRPGALFGDEFTAAGYLDAAREAGVMLLADPSPFWGTTGVWQDDGNVVTPAAREAMFNQLKSQVNGVQAGEIFLGYYQWDQPAWRYYDSRLRLGTPRPAPSYVVNTSEQVRTLEDQENANHAVFIGQGDAVKVRDLFPLYHAAADVVGCLVEPYPAPGVLQGENENPDSPKRDCLLPNYYPSVTGNLADVVLESARAASAGQPLFPVRMCKPYIAILQANKKGGSELTKHRLRFQALDAVIHGAKGLVWYDDNNFNALGFGEYFYKDVLYDLFSLFTELSGQQVLGCLTGDYDHPLLSVNTRDAADVVVEESTFVGGKMVPKTHFLSDKIIMEGVAKEFNGLTYVIVACRSPEGTPGPFTVQFRPYFSNYDYWKPWPGSDWNTTVAGVYPPERQGWVTVVSGSYGGYWEDTFYPEDVAIYSFETPPTWWEAKSGP